MKRLNVFKWSRSILFPSSIFLFICSPLLASNQIIKINEDIYVSTGETTQEVLGIRSQVRVDGTVKENAVAVLGHVTLGSSATVQGNVFVLGGKIIQAPGSQIKGSRVSIDPGLKALEKYFYFLAPIVGGFLAALIGASILLAGLGFLALAIFILIFLEGSAYRTQKAIWADPLMSFVWGLIAIAASIPIMAILVITIIGIPFALAGLAILFAGILLGLVAVGLGIGEEISNRFQLKLKTVWSGLLGMTILLIIAAVPIVGDIFKFAVSCFALGGVIKTRFQR